MRVLHDLIRVCDMPPPRKVDLLPSEFKSWLNEALKERGFSGYEELAEDLNFKLAEEGFELRIQKSALHTYGKEYSEFIKHQEEASAWAAGWMQDNGLEEEAQRHNVLFQMVTTLAFKSMQSQMTKDGDEIDPRELHFIGKMLKDIMASSGIRQKMLEDERERIVAEERAAMADKLEQAVTAGEVEQEAAARAREIMGFG
ncbi:phage protein Gp27 family protein [Epibacterium ulvae]|uniref:phage protein Gp27 family protein n=1 Tax=Epibacterium ulvae TaxID=1156985 RepID=UPI002491A861|nr:phage protein Gp27 family protein [Epibacterium ulvae]